MLENNPFDKYKRGVFILISSLIYSGLAETRLVLQKSALIVMVVFRTSIGAGSVVFSRKMRTASIYLIR
jgi:hypothetical protein